MRQACILAALALLGGCDRSPSGGGEDLAGIDAAETSDLASDVDLGAPRDLAAIAADLNGDLAIAADMAANPLDMAPIPDMTPILDMTPPSDMTVPADMAIPASDMTPLPDDMATPPDLTPGCGTLPADPTDVFVDHAAAEPGTGTAQCPFPTIAQAIALLAPAGSRTIHVAAGSYVEAVLIALVPRVHLEGAGESLVSIAGGATACATAGGNCTVSLGPDSKLSGVTVRSMTGFAVEIASNGAGAVIDHVIARDSNNDGFTIRASATLSHVSAIANKRWGLTGRGLASPIMISITDGDFSQNQMGGVQIDRFAALTFDGGVVSDNSLDGISLQDSSLVSGGRAFELANLLVSRNLGYGIYAQSTATLRARNLTTNQNEAGLVFAVGTGNTLDIGTAASPGNNVFGGPTLGNTNIRAGVCIERSGASGSQLAEDNSWKSCPPSSRKSSSTTCHGISTYADVGYAPVNAASGSPISPTACTVGP